MSNWVPVMLLTAVAGLVGGIMAGYHRGSGALALILSLVPIAGIGLMAAFC